jgi:hypothetical protein
VQARADLDDEHPECFIVQTPLAKRAQLFLPRDPKLELAQRRGEKCGHHLSVRPLDVASAHAKIARLLRPATEAEKG